MIANVPTIERHVEHGTRIYVLISFPLGMDLMYTYQVYDRCEITGCTTLKRSVRTRNWSKGLRLWEDREEG